MLGFLLAALLGAIRLMSQCLDRSLIAPGSARSRVVIQYTR